jgi:hypothetical protein
LEEASVIAFLFLFVPLSVLLLFFFLVVVSTPNQVERVPDEVSDDSSGVGCGWDVYQRHHTLNRALETG